VTPNAVSPTPRNQPCPCGSGKRYKHCCGAKTSVVAEIANTIQAAADDPVVASATEQFRQGEAFASKGLLDAIDPARLSSPQSALEAANIYRELGELRREFDFLARAWVINPRSSSGWTSALISCLPIKPGTRYVVRRSY